MRAAAFAADRHLHQRRKDNVTPYINHPIALARVLQVEGGIHDPIVIAAALLHDTVEDTATTHAELVDCFGPEVAGVVAEVTDDKTLPKAERKRLQIEHAPHLSDRARLVKLADKICNLRDLRCSPPVGWSREWRRNYFDWARRVINRLRGSHPGLEAVFDEAYRLGLRSLDLPTPADPSSPSPSVPANPPVSVPPSPPANAAPPNVSPTSIYWAGPLFTAAEQQFNRDRAAQLRSHGYPVYLPQEACTGLSDPQAIFQQCLQGLQRAAVVVAVLDGADADSGTCWECGYAFRAGIPVVALRTDFRGSGDFEGFNAMLYGAAAAVVTGADDLDRRLVAAIAPLLLTHAQPTHAQPTDSQPTDPQSTYPH
jgi:guanosine-3',5'-bis(diphosphate) 3'-pyrophosphohydrolase